MNFAIVEPQKAIQVKPITPAMYKSLTEEFQLSYDYDPENLTQPPTPLVEFDIKKPGPGLPSVDQAPMSVLHPGSKRKPHPEPIPPPSPPPSYND